MSQLVEIQNVSDTSLWVAHYRAMESERSDALFKDPFAKTLVGERGRKIAEGMKHVGQHAQWSVVSRTVMIDNFIRQLISEGVTTFLNLGAGLDTRPYRMNLPKTVRWIEVDFPHIISYKTDILKNETSTCELARVPLDLSDAEQRKRFFEEVNSKYGKIAVLTEGVILYLTPDQVGELADDLNACPSMVYWITEYFSPHIYRYLKAPGRAKAMKNAPFQFYPPDWLGFFKAHHWEPKEIQYSMDVAIKNNRIPPMPWFVKFFLLFASKATVEKSRTGAGFMILKRV